MALAKQCDNCKKLIENTDQERSVKLNDRDWIVRVKISSDWVQRGQGYDFCNECLSEVLKKFLQVPQVKE